MTERKVLLLLRNSQSPVRPMLTTLLGARSADTGLPTENASPSSLTGPPPAPLLNLWKQGEAPLRQAVVQLAQNLPHLVEQRCSPKPSPPKPSEEEEKKKRELEGLEKLRKAADSSQSLSVIIM